VKGRQKPICFVSLFLCSVLVASCNEGLPAFKHPKQINCEEEIRFTYLTNVNAFRQSPFEHVVADAKHGLSKPAHGRNILGSAGFREVNNIDYFPLCTLDSREPLAIYLRVYHTMHPNSALDIDFEMAPDLAMKVSLELAQIAMPLNTSPTFLKSCAVNGAPKEYLCGEHLPEANFLLAKLYSSCTLGLHNKQLAEDHLQIARLASVTLSDEFIVSNCGMEGSK
jgi:hypothetical protein